MMKRKKKEKKNDVNVIREERKKKDNRDDALRGALARFRTSSKAKFRFFVELTPAICETTKCEFRSIFMPPI